MDSLYTAQPSKFHGLGHIYDLLNDSATPLKNIHCFWNMKELCSSLASTASYGSYTDINKVKRLAMSFLMPIGPKLLVKRFNFPAYAVNTPLSLCVTSFLHTH